MTQNQIIKVYLLLASAISLPALAVKNSQFCYPDLNTALVMDPQEVSPALVKAAIQNKALSDYLFQIHTPSDLARALIPKVSRMPKIAKTGGWNPVKDAEIVLFFYEHNVDGILKNGFLNFHQTGLTNGTSTRPQRANFEDFLIQVRIEEGGYGNFVRASLMEAIEKDPTSLPDWKRKKLAHTLNLQSPFNRFRPKFAYLAVPNMELDIGEVVFRSHFGQIGALFKDSVKNRSTWTPTDSLLANPDNLFSFVDQRVSVQASKTSTERYYLEAQVWGDLSVRDIEAWLVPDTWDSKNPTLKRLQKTGLPIRRYRVEQDPRYPLPVRRLVF